MAQRELLLGDEALALGALPLPVLGSISINFTLILSPSLMPASSTVSRRFQSISEMWIYLHWEILLLFQQCGVFYPLPLAARFFSLSSADCIRLFPHHSPRFELFVAFPLSGAPFRRYSFSFDCCVDLQRAFNRPAPADKRGASVPFPLPGFAGQGQGDLPQAGK